MQHMRNSDWGENAHSVPRLRMLLVDTMLLSACHASELFLVMHLIYQIEAKLVCAVTRAS